jgi:hypothetical protein
MYYRSNYFFAILFASQMVWCFFAQARESLPSKIPFSVPGLVLIVYSVIYRMIFSIKDILCFKDMSEKGARCRSLMVSTRKQKFQISEISIQKMKISSTRKTLDKSDGAWP